jgi:hypothetical protein
MLLLALGFQAAQTPAWAKDARAELLRDDLRAATASDPYRSLMIVHPNILRHDDAQPAGPWSFGGLLLEIAKAHHDSPELTPEQYDSFVRDWLESLYETRPGIRQHVTCLWATGKAEDSDACDTTLLRPEHAPFKLMAINYRPDFVKEACSGEEGELRLNFALTLERPEGQKPHELAGGEMTVIFEYDLGRVDHIDMKPADWAVAFQQLSSPDLCADFCADYTAQLQALVSTVTRYNPLLGRDKVALGQIRTNEIVGDTRFRPELTAALRQVGEVFSSCYTSLLQDPEHIGERLRHCAQALGTGPTAMLADRLAFVLDRLGRLSALPVAAPVPETLVNAFSEALAALSNRVVAVWEMREAGLTASGLRWRPAKDTPTMSANNTPELAQLIAEHEDAIVDASIDLNQVLEAGGFERATAVLANPFDGWRFTGDAEIFADDMRRDVRARSKFSQLTCSGCHATQTASIGLVHVVSDVLRHAKRTNMIAPRARELLAAHRDEALELENLDAFYMISPLRDPGETGKGHLAAYLTKPGGELDKRSSKMAELAKDGALCLSP